MLKALVKWYRIDVKSPSDFVSYSVLIRTKSALESIGMLGECTLWGSWARYFATQKAEIAPEDVDIIISPKLCKGFYRLVVAFRKQELHPMRQIPDTMLDKYLELYGMRQEPIHSIPEHGTAWGICPRLKNDVFRKRMGLNLDLFIDKLGLQCIPNSNGWRGAKDHDDFARKLGFGTGCTRLLASSKKSELNISFPARESQVHFYKKLLGRAERYEVDKSKIVEALTQLGDP